MCSFDFSDVDAALARFDRDVDRKVKQVGDEAVQYAVDNGTYTDRTGNLRASNKSRVCKNHSLELENDADYASYVEAKGYDVIGGAALYAEKRLKEIFGK